MNNQEKINFVFFGTPHFAVHTLEELEKGGLLPSLIVTAPDRPAGRGMKLTPPPVKVWAQERNIPVLQPEALDGEFISKLKANSYQLFIVAAYGKIIPQEVLDIPKHGTLNVHPSLLPKYRGPSPLESAILAGDTETGVAIMEMDAQMDHGKIISNFQFPISNDDTKLSLGEKLFRKGGEMLVEIIPRLIAGEIEASPQDHQNATYTKKIKKEDGFIELNDDPELNWRKFRAYHPWPGVYFFDDAGMRIKITDAALEYPRKSAFDPRPSAHEPRFVIKKVTPERKKEMNYVDFLENQM